MKKAHLLFLASTLACSMTFAQSTTKPSIEDVAKKAAAVTDKQFGFTLNSNSSKQIAKSVGDTLEVLKDAKFIKVNGKTIDVTILNNAVIILSEKDLESFLAGVQEYPAKIANPFTAYFLKFFGLTLGDPKK